MWTIYLKQIICISVSIFFFISSALSEQECVQCALFLIWSLSDLSDQMWPGLHCTIALGRVQFLFTSYFPTKSENCTGCLYATELHTHRTRLDTSFALCTSLLFMIWLWKAYAPNKRTRGVFSSLFTFTPASLAGWQLCTAGTDRSTTRLWEQLNTC